MTEARAYLARKPIPPLSPTKQLILRLAAQVARLHDSEPEALDLIAEARAYLAQPEPNGPTPIPLTERQPTKADCDADGRYWMFSPVDLNVGLFGVAAHWVLRKPDIEIDEGIRTHWLPYWAIPVPSMSK